MSSGFVSFNLKNVCKPFSFKVKSFFMNLHFEAVEWPFPGFERWQLPEKGFQGGGFRLSGASREDMDSLRHPSFLAYILAYLLKWKITHFENVENFPGCDPAVLGSAFVP
jgi:hypothetical protein